MLGAQLCQGWNLGVWLKSHPFGPSLCSGAHISQCRATGHLGSQEAGVAASKARWGSALGLRLWKSLRHLVTQVSVPLGMNWGLTPGTRVQGR